MTENVFQHNHRVVDESRERQRQASQHHGVHRAAGEIENDECRQRRERNRETHGHGRTHAAQENQDHEGREEQANASLVQQRLNRVLDESGLVKHHSRDQCFRNVEQVSDRFLDAIHHRDGIRISALLQNRQVNRWLAVHAHDVALNLPRVLGHSHVAHGHRRGPQRLQRKAVDVVHVAKLAVGVNGVIQRPDAHLAGRKDQVGIVHGPHHVHGAQLVSLEFQRVDVHHDLSILPAERLRDGSPGHAGNLISDRELRKVAQRSLA